MRYGVGKAVAELSDSVTKTAVTSVIVGICAATGEYITHTTLAQAGISEKTHAIVDSCVVGVAAGLLLWFLLSATRIRRRRVLERVRTVSDLNHRIRNALQIIVSSHYLPPPEQAQAILESVQRIDSTLRELFPTIGERADERQTAPRAVTRSELKDARRRGKIPGE